jgi:hypothetical protein
VPCARPGRFPAAFPIRRPCPPTRILTLSGGRISWRRVAEQTQHFEPDGVVRGGPRVARDPAVVCVRHFTPHRRDRLLPEPFHLGRPDRPVLLRSPEIARSKGGRHRSAAAAPFGDRFHPLGPRSLGCRRNPASGAAGERPGSAGRCLPRCQGDKREPVCARAARRGGLIAPASKRAPSVRGPSSRRPQPAGPWPRLFSPILGCLLP